MAQTFKHDESRRKSRRDFLLFIPFTVLAGVAATLAAAALKFLRPMQTSAETKWADIGPTARLTGDKPVMRSVMTERTTGWANTVEEHFVFVLPNRNFQVLSAACPHEGCNVVWRDESNNFFCPCHDSSFAADGSRTGGPARRGLDPLPSRQENGVLKVQYRSFVNNTSERVVRG